MGYAAILDKLCGKSVITKAKTKYLCTKHDSSLQSVDITQDSPTIHPQYFCHSYKTVLKKAKSSEYELKISVFVGWCEHREGSCSVCQQFRKVEDPIRYSTLLDALVTIVLTTA